MSSRGQEDLAAAGGRSDTFASSAPPSVSCLPGRRPVTAPSFTPPPRTPHRAGRDGPRTNQVDKPLKNANRLTFTVSV